MFWQLFFYRKSVVNTTSIAYAPSVQAMEAMAAQSSSNLPLQIHHFATNKHSVWTPRMESVAQQFGLELNGAWNKAALPHLGRHPNEYHQFVFQNMQRAASEAGSSQAKFLLLFDQYVKQPVLQNPNLLRKSGW